MTIVFDMSTGSIQSEQDQAHKDRECEITAPAATALQMVQEAVPENAREASTIHLIHALLQRD